MLIAAFILVISVVAMVQFAMFSWRAGLVRVAAVQFAANGELSPAASRNLLTENDFQDIAAYQELCPELTINPAPKLRAVRLYYSLLETMNSLGASWTSREMTLCTRYATVVLAQRLERNQALLAEVRSY